MNPEINPAEPQFKPTLDTPTALTTGNVEVTFPKRKAKFYSITDSEINTYAQLGWFATVLLTLFGAFVGVSSGSYLTLQQKDLPINTVSSLNSVMWTTGIVAAIFLLLAIVLIIIQAKNKKSWEQK
jgi:hypothetical protein